MGDRRDTNHAEIKNPDLKYGLAVVDAHVKANRFWTKKSYPIANQSEIKIIDPLTWLIACKANHILTSVGFEKFLDLIDFFSA